MCTRYALEKDLPELKDIFEIALRSSLTSKFVDTHARPLITDGEVRPTDIVPVIAPNAKGIKSVFPMHWGFLARDGKRSLFNARVESAMKKPTFKDAWKSHRCIIPASYYFEWEHFKKIPYLGFSIIYSVSISTDSYHCFFIFSSFICMYLM